VRLLKRHPDPPAIGPGDPALLLDGAVDQLETLRQHHAGINLQADAASARRFLERLSEAFSTKPWACSMSQVNWALEGYEGSKLSYLASCAGFFYERHRALDDCLATIELLRSVSSISGRSMLGQLLEKARQPTWRIWAENSPYDLKDVLKARGYHWNGNPGPQPRAWYVDVADIDKEVELNFLRSEIYRGEIDLLVRRIDAYDRFSDRC